MFWKVRAMPRSVRLEGFDPAIGFPAKLMPPSVG
jgi:hypothetical protein